MLMKPSTATFSEKIEFFQDSRSQHKQALRHKIQAALWAAQDLPVEACLSEIRSHLLAIQKYCDRKQKKFIFVEETIACNQFDLGGSNRNTATLFRGPSQDASVAICVTRRGSLLHRNDSPWIAYKNAGDVKTVFSMTNPFCLL